MSIAPFRLSPWFSPRPWGSRSLLPWFDLTVPERCEPIGEAWLTSQDCVIESGPHRGHTLGQLLAQHPAEMLGAAMQKDTHDYPLLLKFIFPQEKLSVQVHPDDEMARSLGQPRGKTECWYCVESSPEGAVALGLKSGVTQKSVREAIREKSLEHLLQWMPVAAGDMIFVDAGTVHAIGPGVVLLETQQQSDVTYRLYDYGRPRELHVDRALEAMRLNTKARKVHAKTLDRNATRLIEKSFFTVDRFDFSAGSTRTVHPGELPLTLVSLTGDVTLEVPGGEAVLLGHAQAVVVPPAHSSTSYELRAEQDAVVICASPGATR